METMHLPLSSTDRRLADFHQILDLLNRASTTAQLFGSIGEKEVYLMELLKRSRRLNQLGFAYVTAAKREPLITNSRPLIYGLIGAGLVFLAYFSTRKTPKSLY